MKKRALISVYKKDGVLELARFLHDSNWEIISTGGTADYFRKNALTVTDVSEVTGFKECLDGRVKTLHPAIHAGILAKRDDKTHLQTLEELGLQTIDLVCVNLYPFFEKSQAGLGKAETIEFIDIGGPAMLRSAAKNFAGLLVLTDSSDYHLAISEIKSGEPNVYLRQMLAGKVFNLTAAYDAAVSRYLLETAREETPESGESEKYDFPAYWQTPFEKASVLRYGENSHQKAALYYRADRAGVFKTAKTLNGKELSYNNIRDADSAWKAVCSFGLNGKPPLGETELKDISPAYCGAALPSCVAVKHNTPCGMACGADSLQAFLKAKLCDPVSIFGGVVAFNCTVTERTAEKLNELFLEIVIAPDFESAALSILKQKKNLRILQMEAPPLDETESVSIDGGLLVQETSRRLFEKWEVVTTTAPTPDCIPDMIFGMRAVSWVKSNAIAVVKDLTLLGCGGGETNRIWAAELAVKRAAQRIADAKQNPEYSSLSAALRDGSPAPVLASDAFFPFSDIVELAAANNIRAIIQCGGSQNDQLSIDACNKHGIAMVFTGVRCFRH
ncbi:MAG: bifunctional phosphoribosylaminoimidazolecarboxamide formyltransferase/IMP cyclohydrolase [Spirochaetaceae bacterium]|jgi:phosphoribosylaminoimidazolecarboxamide formyltransferase/IMP cyclohydrolase|nr:bifunctional phosphoribosylaminoimidazolecarboxamide formyltransferase/IMP cyclohydrolase [Spirochaetaceae bacterium]